MKKRLQIKKSTPEVYEHLDHYLQKTTPAQRWEWLKQTRDFVNMIEGRRKKGTLFVR
jgi:hypothetical protein